MTGISENGEQPILNVEGDLVALGPLRRDLLPLYTRWINVHYTKKATSSTPVHNRVVRVTANGSKVTRAARSSSCSSTTTPPSTTWVVL